MSVMCANCFQRNVSFIGFVVCASFAISSRIMNLPLITAVLWKRLPFEKQETSFAKKEKEKKASDCSNFHLHLMLSVNTYSRNLLNAEVYETFKVKQKRRWWKEINRLGWSTKRKAEKWESKRRRWVRGSRNQQLRKIHLLAFWENLHGTFAKTLREYHRLNGLY